MIKWLNKIRIMMTVVIAAYVAAVTLAAYLPEML
jgi:hypothetical protein